MEQSKHSEGITSVKVHHQPGGASSFSIAHDTGVDDRWGNTGKVGSNPQPRQSAAAAAQQQSSIFGGSEE